MPLLIDTHFILWLRVEPHRLREAERTALNDASSRFVSVVSLWEIAIMLSIGRLRPDGQLLGIPLGFDLLPVGQRHCQTYATLPMHHRDPFDRMLVAQARSEGMPLLTRDRAIAAYSGEATILQYPAR